MSPTPKTSENQKPAVYSTGTRPDGDNILPETIQRLESALTDISVKATAEFTSSQQSRMEAFDAIRARFMETVEETQAATTGIDTTVFRKIEKKLVETIQWMDALVYFPDGVPHKRIWYEWANAYSRIEAELPDAIELVIPAGFWTPSSFDDTRTRYQKAIGRIQEAFLRCCFSLSKAVFFWRQAPPDTAPAQKRTPQVRKFLSCFV
ncbi:MAG: hypothetical protein HKP58_20305, partial [Desulfatitalea sp.]|nr:hypothetical protein [Desulfatitalea sp.]NNK02761.1 hypothetical protein [Desulfatitalea sp.]